MTDQLLPGTHTVVLALGDLCGILRGKRMHASQWDGVAEHGMAMAGAIFVFDMTCDIWDTPFANMDNGYPDIYVTPIPGTLRPVPWADGTMLAIGAATQEGGAPVPVDPRRALEGVIGKFDDHGYQAKIGVEFEFYLLDPETRTPVDNGVQVYGVARGAQFEHVLGPIRNQCTEFGIPIEVSNPEYSSGQFEVNIRYGDALTAVDNAVLFRNAVKEIAAQHGFLATFMAKPFTAESGNGLHIHQSLWQGDTNIFADGNHLSDIGRCYVGGLRKHMVEFTLFGAPTPNSYKRRTPYSFCPANNSWGGDNRTVGIRVIEGRPSAVRVEQRDASAEANPYMVVAGQLAAGLRGIEEELDPGPRNDGDAYAEAEADALPTSIPEAVEALRGSEFAAEVFDAQLLEVVIQMAEREEGFLRANVTDFERDRYLEVY
ncbi:MAG: glutamine synthetase family protein [Acidimicrobiia bacterium]